MSSTSCKPLWALVDCNNFYASCEKLFRPDLADKPVVVLSNNDGCIVARSKEAKALGIPMGEPEYKARGLLRQHSVTVFSSNYALYGDISSRVMATLESVCPHVEQYSIDEAFIRLDGALCAQAHEVASTLRAKVQQWTGMTVSVGVARTRTLAKIANHLAKKGNGICLLPDAGMKLDDILSHLPVAEVWGIGRRQARKLHAIGITSALGLRDANDPWVRKNLTITGWKTMQELRGLPCIGEGEGLTPRHTLVSSRSFGQKVYDKEALEQAIATFTARAAERLRKEKLVAGGIAVHIRTARHGEGPKFDSTVQQPFMQGTSDTGAMLYAAQHALSRAYKEGPAYAKAGVMLYDLSPEGCQQRSLLATSLPEQDVKRVSLMAALDGINRRYGKRSMYFGAEGPVNAVWHMRQNRCSPRVTTDWKELVKALCK